MHHDNDFLPVDRLWMGKVEWDPGFGVSNVDNVW